MTKSAPSGRELEIALHELLRKSHFTGVGRIGVRVVGPEPAPVYILTLGPDVAKALGNLLDPLLFSRTRPNPMGLVLFRSDVEAILKAAQEP